MRKAILSYWIVGFSLVATAIGAWAQGGEDVEWTHHFAAGLEDGSTLVGGHRVVDDDALAGCGPSRRAFVARRAADGSELWRAQLPPVAGLVDLDPQYVLATMVHDAAVDPQTGEIYAVVEALTAWQGTTCAVATAVGTSVFRLAANGTLLGDVYLGERPVGSPAGAFDCRGRCAPDRLPQLVGRSIAVEPDGQIRVAGWRRGARGEPADEDAFVLRLASDLTYSQTCLTLFRSGQGSTSDLVCSLSTDSTLVSLSELPDTAITGSHVFLSTADDCIIQINYAGPGALQQYPDYGIEAEFDLPAAATSLVLKIAMTLPTYYHDAVIVLLKDWREGGRFDPIATLTPDGYKKIDATISHGDPSPYINAAGTLLLRLVFKYGSLEPDYAESVDLDHLEILP